MKIILLAKDYPPTIGGVENYSFSIAEGLGEFYDLEVLTFFSKKNSRVDLKDSVQVTRINSFISSELTKGIFLFFFLIGRLFKNKDTIVFATTWKVAIPAYLLKYFLRFKLVVVCHGAEITRHKESWILMRIMRNVIAVSDRIIAVSCFTKSIVLKYTGAFEESVSVVPNGIDLRKLAPKNKQMAREFLGLSAGLFVVGTISRIDYRKGHEVVIRAIPEIVKARPDFLYLIVGDGPNRAHLENLVNDLGVSGFVRFSGFVNARDLDYYYSSFDIFVMINEMNSDKDFEGFGLVFAEAGFYGKPLIGGNNSGPKEVIEHGYSGLLVESSKEAVATAILEFVRIPGLVESYGINARNRTISKFSVDNMVRLTNEVILRVF
jgi:phosphatidylinositol alpha-1,6-mannosyltransferase